MWVGAHLTTVMGVSNVNRILVIGDVTQTLPGFPGTTWYGMPAVAGSSVAGAPGFFVWTR